MATCVSHPTGDPEVIESSKNKKKFHVEYTSLVKVSESCADNRIINGLIPSPSWFETRQK